MSDVRLTATNPEDSSVVPVACNTKGELLVEDVVIEEIDNNLTVRGNVEVITQTQGVDSQKFRVNAITGSLSSFTLPDKEMGWVIYTDGKALFNNYVDDTKASAQVCGATYAFLVTNHQNQHAWKVAWDGSTRVNRLEIAAEPNKTEHYSSVKNTDTEEEFSEYIGPVLDVGEELVFLRAQVRALMEKLRMTPEGGWPVWDGSPET